jgi:hypothetical protein
MASMSLGDEQRIEIITTLSAPVEPVTLQSVMEPIAKQWVKSRASNVGREQFWRGRRARALPEFIPVSPEVLAAMVRGWFLGRILGEINYDKAQVSTLPVEIFDPTFEKWIPFPYPYLGGQPTGEQDLLPAILESMPISMLDAQTQGNTEPMKPYQLLRSIGEEVSNSMRNWILFGNTPHRTVPMDRAWRHPEFIGAAAQDATPVDRQKAVIAYVQGRMRNYVQRLDEQPVTMANLQTQPRWLDLRDQLAAAFDLLAVEAAGVSTYEAEDGGD